MLDAILSDHLRRCPALQLQDLYKLIHQAARGSEHAALARLQRELAVLGAGPVEPVIDPIPPCITRRSSKRTIVPLSMS